MRWLERTLSTIPEKYAVVIIDNASTDTTISYIKTNYPKFKLFEETINLGFGQANNKGISYALSQNATAVFLLNQDAYLESDTISKLEEHSTAEPTFGILSPVHYNGDGKTLDGNFSSYMAYNHAPTFYRDALMQEIQPIYEVAFVNAAAWYLPIKTLMIVGGFDPMFFHYGEDDNYVQRVSYHNLKLGVVSTSRIYHDREPDKNIKLKVFSEEYFKHREKRYKVLFGDIRSVTFEEQLLDQKRKLNRSTILSILKLNFYKAKQYTKESSMLKSIETTIRASRKKNITQGKNYL